MVKIGIISYIRRKRISRINKKLNNAVKSLEAERESLSLEAKLFSQKKEAMLKKTDLALSSANNSYSSYSKAANKQSLDNLVSLARAEQALFDKSINSFVDTVAFLYFYSRKSESIRQKENYISKLNNKLAKLEAAQHNSRLSYIAKRIKTALNISERRNAIKKKQSSIISYINKNPHKSLDSIASSFYKNSASPEKKLKKAVLKSLSDGFYIEKYNNALASDNMKKDIVKQYSTNYTISLKQIAENLSRKYNMHISESTIRKYARKELGNVSRRDRSAEAAYRQRHRILKLSVLRFGKPKENIYKESRTPVLHKAY